MPALNFQKQFADDVESGVKRRTIRALRKDGRDPKKGDVLYLYTGMRTKVCRKLGEAKCIRVRNIKITHGGVWLDGKYLLAGHRDSLGEHKDPEQFDGDFAQADGFTGFSDMTDWFENTHALPFEGKLIEWGNR